jgi:signal transduction histidine kinase
VPLPAAVDAAAYRIVQEALTNVVRHAGPAAVHVALDYRGSELTVDIAENGAAQPARSTSNSGTGIAGMRERVGVSAARVRTRFRSSGSRVGARVTI